MEELVASTGYHSDAVVQWMKRYQVRSYIPEKQQKDGATWQGKADKRKAAYQNRGGCEAVTAIVCSGDVARWQSTDLRIAMKRMAYGVAT